MAERRNTIVCTFDLASPKITAYEIHEWIHNTIRIPEQTVTRIQIDGTRRQVFIKLIANEYVQSLLRETGGVPKDKHQNGEMSTVAIAGKD